MLEQIGLLCNRIIQNINNIVLLLIPKQINIQHRISSHSSSWIFEASIGIPSIIPVEAFNLLHILKVSRERNSHPLSNHSFHDCLASLNFIGVGSIDDDGAWVLEHDPEEGALVALVVDLDVVRVLPVDVDIMVIDASDLGLD